MSFSRMKPIPKFLIIAGATAAVVFGVSVVVEKVPALTAKKGAPPPAVATPVPAESASQPIVVTAPPPNQATPPVPETPVVQPSTASDAGLANVLGSTKK